MLNLLKNLQIDREGLEELVAVLAFGKSLQAEFDLQGIDQPEWLEDRIKLLTREVRDRNHDQLQAKLRKAKTALASMATPEQKRASLQKQIKQLETQLLNG